MLPDWLIVKGNRIFVWYDGKEVYVKDSTYGKYQLSKSKRSTRVILEFRQQLKDIDKDFAEGISSDRQKINQLITTNTILKDSLTDIPVDIGTQSALKGIIDNALDFNPEDVESPETVVNEVENTICDIKKEGDGTSHPDTRKY